MNLPGDTLRQAIYTALSGNVGLTVYSWPPKSAGDYVLIGDISEHDDSYQTMPIFDCYVPIEIITKSIVRDNTQGSKKLANQTARLIDAIMKPTLLTFLPITGWNVTNSSLDDKSEDLSVDQDNAVFRIMMTYYIRIVKT